MRVDRIFCDLPTADLQAFETIKYATAYPKGAVLFVEGQAPRGLFVLCKGRVKLSICASDGKTLILKIADPGEVLGLSATVSGKPYELRPTDLFRSLLVTSGAMTKRVARLQDGGFVFRVSANDDGRSELVRLTAKGLTTADRGIAEIAEVVESVREASGLTRAEIAALDRSLRKLLAVRLTKSKKRGRTAAAE